jgi:hypothetical protein
MYKTIVAGWLPIPLVERLDERAREQRTSRSQLISDVLSMYVDGKPLEPIVRTFGNRDGKNDEAEDIIREHAKCTVLELVDILKAAGCPRGKNWVTDHRRKLLAKGATVQEG